MRLLPQWIWIPPPGRFDMRPGVAKRGGIVWEKLPESDELKLPLSGQFPELHQGVKVHECGW